jgi:hypothetical protein
MTKTKLVDVTIGPRENMLVAAISDILINAASENDSNKLVIVIP